MTPSSERRAASPGFGATLRRWLATPLLQAIIPLVLVVGLGCAFNQRGAFFAWSTHRDMLREVAVHGILACGMTVVVLTAGIDLAVGSVLALSAVGFAVMLMPLGVHAALAVAATVGLGLTIGSTSGALVARYRMQPFVVTLAVMVFARGLAKQLAGGRKVTSYVAAADGTARSVDLPAIFDSIDAKVLHGNVAIVTLVLAGVLLVSWVLLTRLRVGRHIYAVGGNVEAARLAGVPVERTLVFAYAYSGLLAAVAGMCQAAQETHGDPETGMGYELDAIAMVVLGGTSLMGGRGGIGQTLIGILTLGYLQKVLSLNAYSSEARLMLTGAIIVGAVLFQRSLGRSSQ
jgi:ribose transport system permease protein